MQIIESECPKLISIQQDSTAGGVPEPKQKLGAGSFACSRRTDKGNRLPWLNAKRNTSQHQGFAGSVGKARVFEFDRGRRAAVRRGRGNPGTVRYGDRSIFNRKDPPGRRQSLHELLERARYLTHRTERCHS